jgi:phosphonoacetaldehyde hydrolase
VSLDAIKAVVFDWAGTMIDFGCRAPVVALRQVFADAGVEITEAEARIDMGKAKRDHIRAILTLPRVADAWREVHGAAAQEADVTRLHDAVEPMMRAAAKECAQLIPGAADLAARLEAAGVKIGSSTGYTRAMMADILPLAAEQGYAPQVVVCAGETLEGRPSPLMMWKALVELGAWPAGACVKVDDAVVGIGEGLAAGAWTVGLSASGNGVGLSLEELNALPPAERERRIASSAQALRAAGAHYVVETVAELGPILEEISARCRDLQPPGHPRNG